MRRLAAVCLLIMLCCVGGTLVWGQAAAKGEIAGTVTDPSGARVARAVVQVRGVGLGTQTTSDSSGHFSVVVAAGTYDVSVSAKGFETLDRGDVVVVAGGHVDLSLKLVIEVKSEQVDVPSENDASTSAADNGSAIVLGKRELAELADDDSTLQQQLLAMAGSDGVHSPDVYIDGFNGGKFPPKNSIREVRINQNPYSAEYPGYGLGRIEIFTKPGGAELHGDLEASGNDAPFNARNPYTGAEPPYYLYYVVGNLNGPLGKKSSFFAGVDRFDAQNNAVVNAVDPTGLGKLSEAVPNPFRQTEFNIRIDRQLSTNNTFTGRYEFSRGTSANTGVGLLVLPSEGYSSGTTTQTLQLSDTQVVTPKIVSETRFQYVRTRLQQTPVSGAPTVVVEGSFNGGGSAAGALRDNQDSYEFQEYVSLARGKHFVRVGGRYRLLRDANDSTANYNGQYLFPTLAAYEASTPTQYSVTEGTSNATILTGDVGVYAEDEWKAGKNFTVNYGLRFESQSAIPDHGDWAPRAGFAWAIGQKDKKPPVVTLRGGSGLFYDRFAAGNLLTAVRQNGISQRTYVVANPAICPVAGSPLQLCVAPTSSVAPTVYGVNPHLQSSYNRNFGVSADRSLGKIGHVSVGYLWTRGMHEFYSRNINAPLPGTYDPTVPGSGVRPLGGTQDVYQFESGGISKAALLHGSASLNLTKRFGLWTFAMYQNRRSDTGGGFASNQYDLREDYGRSAIPRSRIFLGGNVVLPWKFSLNPFFVANSSAPFNITTGTDLNGDAQYNDRPAFATDLTRASVVKTKYGTFDTAPMPGQTIIPINYGSSPSFRMLSLNGGKSFGFGPKAPPEKLGGPKGDPKYSLGFYVEAENVLNLVNRGQPVGVLSSPLFGQSISLNPGFSNNAAANRTVSLRTEFSF